MMLRRLQKFSDSPPPKRRRYGVLSAFLSLYMVSTSVSFANVIGTDTQNFNPIPSGLDFVTVQSSETLEPGVINFGLFLNQAVNTLPYFEDNPQGRNKFTDSLLGADLHIGIGLLPGLDIGLSAPQVLHQKADSDGFHGQFAENGNTELRVASKLRLWGESDYGVAAVATVNLNRIRNNPYVGEDAGPTYNLELVADTTIKKIALGFNIGHRWRSAGEKIEDPIDPLGDQLIASVAASYLLSSIDTKVIVEVFGSKPTGADTENSDRLSESAEALLGLKYDFTSSIAGHMGAGTEMTHGRASPDWRVYVGMNYATGPIFSQKRTSNSPASASVPATKNDPFAGPLKPKEKIVIHDILFEFDSDSLVLQGADHTLTRLVAYLNRKPAFTRLVIEGHTDSVGTDQYNAALSHRRAMTIKRWLVSRYKLDARKIEAVGRGERAPIADNGNYQGRQLNRRVEFTIYRDMP